MRVPLSIVCNFHQLMLRSLNNKKMDINRFCRLCGRAGASVKAEGDVKQTIFDVLHLETSEMICERCESFLQQLNVFKLRTRSIQEMFDELEKAETETEILTIRARFGLSIEEIVMETDSTIVKQEETLNDHVFTEYLLPIEGDDDCETEEYLDENDDEVECSNTKVRKTYQRKKIEKTENEKLYEFKCHVCSEEFPKMQSLSIHCRTVHQTNPQVLCWCGALLSTWKRLMAHKSKHIQESDEYKCDCCSISYKTKIAFEKHLKARHGPDGPIKFVCSICGKQFKERQILKNHERVHLPDDLKLKHPCLYCGKKFVNSHCLKIHIARIHEKVALHTCEVCGKSCITKSDLKWHMDKHVEERNYECEICQLKFKSPNSLRIHKRRHLSSDKIVVCQVCGKEFHSSAALSNHKLVHSDVKRYKCFCGNEYKRLESYKCHLSTHTGERPFGCLWCSRTFVNSANCRKHKLKDHPLEVAQYEAIHGKKGVSLAMKVSQNT